mgnify:CR=1 FL=1
MPNSNEIPLPLLITGCAGVPGYNAFRYFWERYPKKVIGIRGTLTWKLQHENIYAVDIEVESALKELFARYRFRSILEGSGSCALKICELNPEHAYRINILGLQSLLRARQEYAPESRLIRLSSDLVFSGNRGGNYRESDPPDPVTVYGKTMMESEQLLMQQVPQALILRISLPMGESFNGHAGAIDWIENRFKKGRPATLYFDEIRTPTYTRDMEPVYEKLLSSSLSGIYHFGGQTRLSLYQIAQIINKIGGYAPYLLKGCLRYEAGPIPPRAGNVTMNSEKFYEAFEGCPFRPWPEEQLFFPTHLEWHQERQDFSNGGSKEIRARLY